MTEKNDVADEERRNVLKGAAATGVAATGIGLFGSASAQQDIRELNVSLSEQGGLLNVNVQNVNVLRNVNVQDVVVTVIGGDVLSDIDIEDIDVDILNNVDVDVLNDSTVQVAVAALSDTGDIVAAGSDALNF